MINIWATTRRVPRRGSLKYSMKNVVENSSIFYETRFPVKFVLGTTAGKIVKEVFRALLQISVKNVMNIFSPFFSVDNMKSPAVPTAEGVV